MRRECLILSKDSRTMKLSGKGSRPSPWQLAIPQHVGFLYLDSDVGLSRGKTINAGLQKLGFSVMFGKQQQVVSTVAMLFRPKG